MAKVDGDKNQELGRRFGVQGFPTIKVYPIAWLLAACLHLRVCLSVFLCVHVSAPASVSASVSASVPAS